LCNLFQIGWSIEENHITDSWFKRANWDSSCDQDYVSWFKCGDHGWGGDRNELNKESHKRSKGKGSKGKEERAYSCEGVREIEALV